MDNSEYYIKRIKIDGLFGYKNIDWHLHKDVNILGGINGSGKSTVINLLNGFIFSFTLWGEGDSYPCSVSFQSAEIEFHNNLILYVYRDIEQNETKKDIIQFIENKYNKESILLTSIKMADIGTSNGKAIVSYFLDATKAKNFRPEETLYKVRHSFIPSEHELISDDIIQSLGDKKIKSTLDLSLFQEIRKRNELVTHISLNQNGDLRSLQEQNGLLIKILNSFFKDTKKRLHEDTTVFNVLTPQGEKISCYDLSTGEKQLLLIFLTAFNSNKKPCIMLMDEPDLGIHIDWKKKLISSIRELNPNAQLILSTHSPSMIEGWFDNVKEMDEITTNA